jgi:hypothetical protein
VGQNAAAKIGAEIFLHPPGDAERARVRLLRMREEALEMVLDDGVERGADRVAPPVDGGGPCRNGGDPAMWEGRRP